MMPFIEIVVPLAFVAVLVWAVVDKIKNPAHRTGPDY